MSFLRSAPGLWFKSDGKKGWFVCFSNDKSLVEWRKGNVALRWWCRVGRAVSLEAFEDRERNGDLERQD